MSDEEITKIPVRVDPECLKTMRHRALGCIAEGYTPAQVAMFRSAVSPHAVIAMVDEIADSRDKLEGCKFIAEENVTLRAERAALYIKIAELEERIGFVE